MADLAALSAKLTCLGRVAGRCGLSGGHWRLAISKMVAGHLQHGNDFAGLDLRQEACRELADLCGYGALALLAGKWSWRWWLALVFGGLAWRALAVPSRSPGSSECDDEDDDEEPAEELTLEQRVARLPSGGLTADEFEDLEERHIQRQEARGVVAPRL